MKLNYIKQIHFQAYKEICIYFVYIQLDIRTKFVTNDSLFKKRLLHDYIIFYETVVFKPSVDKIPLSGHLLTVRFCVLNSFLVYLLWNIWHVTISIRLRKGCVLLSRRKDAFFNECLDKKKPSDG